MKRNILIILSITMAFFLALSTGFADEKDTESKKGKSTEDEKTEEELKHIIDVTVSASPILEGSEVTRYGEKIDVVTEKQIDDLNAQDLATSLYRVPGVMMSRHNLIGAYGGGDGGAVFIRGHGSSRPGQEIGTYIDGIPKFSGIWTHSLLDMLPVDIARRIDVYKSSQSVLLGNMSFAAVNILPKRRKKEGSNGRIYGAYGEHQTWVLRFDYGVKSGDVDLFFTGSHRASRGHRRNSEGSTQSAYGHLGYEIGSNWEISFQAHHTGGEVNDPGPLTIQPLPVTPSFATRSELYILKATHEYDLAEGSVRIYYDNGLQDWLQWDRDLSEPFSSVTDYGNYGIRIREALNLWEGSEILVGFDNDYYGGKFVEKRPAENRYDTDLTLSNSAPYLMLSQSFGESPQFIISAGARYNLSSHFEDRVGYQAGILIDIDNFIIHGGYAHGFNLPGIYTAVLFGGGEGGDAWKELDAELIDHYEIGINHMVSEDFRYNISYFSDDVENALRVVFPGPKYMNVGEYETKGVEMGLNLSPVRHMDIFLGGTWAETTPEEIPYSPEFTLSGGLNYFFFNKVRLSLMLQHIGEHYAGNPRTPAPSTLIEAYTLLNGRIGMPFGRKGSDIKGELFLAAENLTNEEYKMKPDYPMPGLTFMTGVIVRF